MLHYTFIFSVVKSRLDWRQQQAAQAREVLQTIIGDCCQFLHPLSEASPYPILHTATAISKEFWSRLDKNISQEPKGKDVQVLLNNEGLLLSICVEGWVSSTQIIRLMGMVEELERKATSHYLRGNLLLVCQASFLLAGIVAEVCSPQSFYDILVYVKPDCCQDDNANVFINVITVDLQNKVCDEFHRRYKEIIKRCLYFIQIACRVFIHLEDWKLVQLAKRPETGMEQRKLIQKVSDEFQQRFKEINHPVSPAQRSKTSALCDNKTETDEERKKREDHIQRFEKESSLDRRLKQVIESLDAIEGDVSEQQTDYQLLWDLIRSIKEDLPTLNNQMDPITTAVVAALSAGLLSELTDADKKVIGDAYDGLRTLLTKEFGYESEVVKSVANLEAKPDSLSLQGTLKEKVEAAHANQDRDLVRSANILLKQIKKQPGREQHIQNAIDSCIAQADRGSTASVTVNHPPQEKL